MLSTLGGVRRNLQWTSTLKRKVVKSRRGGEAYAFSGMVDHISLLREFYPPYAALWPGKIGPEDCESLFPRLRSKKTVAEEDSVSFFSGIQQSLGSTELDSTRWLPGA